MEIWWPSRSRLSLPSRVRDLAALWWIHAGLVARPCGVATAALRVAAAGYACSCANG